MNKKITIKTILFFFIVGVFSFPSCCTKKACANEIFTFELYNFNPADIDTIIISKYIKGSGFTNPIDVSTISAFKPNGVNYYYAYFETVDADHDYVVKIPGAALTYSLTEFSTSKQKCNSCFPYTPKSDYQYYISEYKLNGQTSKDFPYKIYK